MFAVADFTRIQSKLFWIMGFDLQSEDNPNPLPAFSLIMASIAALYSAAMAAFVIANISNVDLFTETLSSLAIGVTCFTKFVLFLKCQKNFTKLVIRMKKVSKTVDREDESILEYEAKKSDILTKFLVLFCFSAATVALIIPLCKMAYSYYQMGEIIYYLPFKGIFPYNWNRAGTYLLTYFWVIQATYTIATWSCAVDSLFCSFCHILCAHFKILQRKMELLRPETVTNLETEIRKIMKHHQNTLDIVSEVNKLFRQIMFVQFTISSLQLCAAGFQLVAKLTNVDFFYFGLYILTAFIQLFIYCYCSERVKTESCNFATSVYMGYWYTFPRKTASSLVLPILRGQNSKSFDGYFFEANLPTLSTIMSTTMSYITMLRSFAE